MAAQYPPAGVELAASTRSAAGGDAAESHGRVTRHAGIDRLFHWLVAVTMLVLLATSLLPVIGIRFAWVEVHWIAGILLSGAVLFHILRAALRKKLRIVVPRPADLAELAGARPGKYSIAQKLTHTAFAMALLTAIGTGVPLMIKAGTPFFERDPYRFSLSTWGWLTVLHDLAAFLSLFLVIVHMYFSLRPEKRMYLRAMISGGMTRDELRQYHDEQRVQRGE